MHARHPRRTGVVFALLALTLAGCSPEPEIRLYDVPRDKSAATSPAATVPAASSTKASTTRMVAAIVLREGQAWFIKSTGSDAVMEKAAQPLQEFIKSIKMPEDQPAAITWTTPEGWTEGRQRMMREATLVMPEAQGAAEVAISKLTWDGDKDKYLLDNIVRWRGQLGLPPVEKLDEAAGVNVLEVDGSQAWLFDAVGSGSGGMKPPMMGMNAPFAGGAVPPRASEPANPPATKPADEPRAPAAKPEIKFAVPEDWTALARGSMGSRSYTIGEGDNTVTVKMSDFPPVGKMADPLTNLNRWRGQVGAERIDEAGLAETTSKVTVADTEGTSSEFTASDESQTMQAIILVKYKQVWFFQLFGTPAAVDAHRDEFKRWLDTIEIVLPEAGKESE